MIARTENTAAIAEKLRPLFRAYSIRRAVLFGSRARGEALPISDVDIVIEAGDHLRGLSFYGLWEDIAEALQQRIDLFEDSELAAGSAIRKNIEDEGIVIYDARER